MLIPVPPRRRIAGSGRPRPVPGGIRSPATICPPASRAAIDSGSAHRSSVTTTTPAVPGRRAREDSSRSCSLSQLRRAARPDEGSELRDRVRLHDEHLAGGLADESDEVQHPDHACVDQFGQGGADTRQARNVGDADDEVLHQVGTDRRLVLARFSRIGHGRSALPPSTAAGRPLPTSGQGHRRRVRGCGAPPSQGWSCVGRSVESPRTGISRARSPRLRQRQSLQGGRTARTVGPGPCRSRRDRRRRRRSAGTPATGRRRDLRCRGSAAARPGTWPAG